MEKQIWQEKRWIRRILKGRSQLSSYPPCNLLIGLILCLIRHNLLNYSLLNFGATITGYIVNNLKLPVRSFGFEGSDFGKVVLSNIGMFGMKKAFSPLVGAISLGMTVIVGAIEKRPTVIDGKI